MNHIFIRMSMYIVGLCTVIAAHGVIIVHIPLPPATIKVFNETQEYAAARVTTYNQQHGTAYQFKDARLPVAIEYEVSSESLTMRELEQRAPTLSDELARCMQGARSITMQHAVQRVGVLNAEDMVVDDETVMVLKEGNVSYKDFVTLQTAIEYPPALLELLKSVHVSLQRHGLTPPAEVTFPAENSVALGWLFHKDDQAVEETIKNKIRKASCNRLTNGVKKKRKDLFWVCSFALITHEGKQKKFTLRKRKLVE